jgi:hypothetical protein
VQIVERKENKKNQVETKDLEDKKMTGKTRPLKNLRFFIRFQ